MCLPVKHHYTFVQILYWMGNNISIGFAAVFLQHKGLSHSLIGLAVGGAAFTAIVFQPFLAEFIEKKSSFTLRRTILLLLFLTGFGFLFLSFFPLPKLALVIMYLLFHTLYNAGIPLITSLGMEYLNQGYPLNFGVSRGAGSLAYAVSAMILGFLLERYCADLISWLFLAVEFLLFCLVFLLKEPKTEKAIPYKYVSSSMFQIMKENPSLISFVLSFCLCFAANCVPGTYMADIVKAAGGSEANLGLCGFLSAGSEMPAMLLCHWLLQRFSCRTLLKASSFFYMCKMAVLFFAPSLPVVYLGFLLQSFSFGMFTTVSVYMINQEVPIKDRIKGQTLFSIATSGLGGGIGNLMGGFMLDTFDLKPTLAVCTAAAALGFLITLSVKTVRWDSK